MEIKLDLPLDDSNKVRAFATFLNTVAGSDGGGISVRPEGVTGDLIANKEEVYEIGRIVKFRRPYSEDSDEYRVTIPFKAIKGSKADVLDNHMDKLEKIEKEAAEVTKPKRRTKAQIAADKKAEKESEEKPLPEGVEKAEITKAELTKEVEETPAKEEASEEEASEEEESTGEESTGEVTHEMIKELLGKKVSANRPAIRDKMNSLGAKKISLLEEEHFEEFFKFLSGLKDG